MSDLLYLERPGKPKLAYRYTPGVDGRGGNEGNDLPLVMFCGGYRSDMNGTKAVYFEEQCAARGQGYVRFDYGGHGDSEGEFAEGTIGAWAEDARDILDHVASGPVIVVGSSMGGWMALLLAKARAEKIRGVVGIAAAPDFTEDIFARLTADQQAEVMSAGFVAVPNDYSDEPYHYTKAFYEEAKAHLLLGHAQEIDFPIRLVQGKRDLDVPWQMAEKIRMHYGEAHVDIVFVDDGDHKLSRPEDLALINGEIMKLSGV